MFKTKINWSAELPNILAQGAQGVSMTEIAKTYGVSKQRIKQVLQKLVPNWKSDFGMAIRKKEKERAHFAKWGQKEDSPLYQAQRQKFRAKKANAIRTGYSWEVEFGDFIWPIYCPILGIEIDYFAETRQENSPSFDRINSNLGYVKGNVQIVSWRANRIKNDGTADEHRKIADYLDWLHDYETCKSSKVMV